jgi:hypothetical protein
VVADKESQKILVALASLRRQGNLDGISGTRDQKLAFMNLAYRRRLVVWRGAQRGYRLTHRGERFLAEHSRSRVPSVKPKSILGTGLPLAGLMLALTGIGAIWLEWPDRSQWGHTISFKPPLVTATEVPAQSNGVSAGPMMHDDASGLHLATTPVNSLEDSRPDPPPKDPRLPLSPTRAESSAVSTQHRPSQATDNTRQGDRMRQVQRTKSVKGETHRRSMAGNPAHNSFGYGWSPYPYNPWQSRW